MKKLSICALAFVSLMATAQNKIDFAGRMAIERVREATETANGAGTVAPKSVNAMLQQTYNVIVEFDDENIDYGDVAVDEISRIDNMVVVNATTEQMEQLAALPQVVAVTLGFEKTPTMYLARPAANVEAVQTGADGLSKKYTGKGVVTGLFDTGLDVNHINFLDADGTPRTKAVWTFASNGTVTAYTTPDKVKGFTTENNSESHATHVLGIMSGSYNGPAEYAYLGGTSGSTPTLVKQDDEKSAIPFYGIATGSDIAAGCGTLSDGNIAAGVQRIVEYAESKGQPCVVNLSLGSNLGPHDGSDGLSKTLAKLGEKAIICIAAGNEGNDDLSITAKGKTIQTFVTPTGSSNQGTLQFWCSDNKPFTISFIGYDKNKSKEVFSYTLDKNLAGKSVKQGDMTGFSDAFTGSVTMSSNIDNANNRYYVSVNINVTGASTTISPGFIIEPADDQTVYGFAYNMNFVSNSVRGFTKGNSENSISSMACGENVIVVGSFTTEPSWASISEGKAVSYSYSPRPNKGAISSFSSYGMAFGGRQLPFVCAPGEGIMSSLSQYFVTKSGGVSGVGAIYGGQYTAPSGRNSRNSPYGLMQGTSMACPFVAGVVGLWLEADPTLTVADVMDVIQKTAITDTYTKVNKDRFGAGKIDALAGIKEVLNSTGISDIKADNDDVIVTCTDGDNYEIFVAGAKRVTARLYSLSGICAVEATSNGDTVQLNANSASAGVYVLKIDTEKLSETRKIVVK